jgi:hypothetical protein
MAKTEINSTKETKYNKNKHEFENYILILDTICI